MESPPWWYILINILFFICHLPFKMAERRKRPVQSQATTRLFPTRVGDNTILSLNQVFYWKRSRNSAMMQRSIIPFDQSERTWVAFRNSTLWFTFWLQGLPFCPRYSYVVWTFASADTTRFHNLALSYRIQDLYRDGRTCIGKCYAIQFLSPGSIGLRMMMMRLADCLNC